MKFTHDVIVIGAGAAGLTAAGGCALFGLKVALIEGGKMGGECLNNGCVPSKALITAAKRAAQARIQTRHGVTLSPPEVAWTDVHRHIHRAIAAIAPHDSPLRFEEMGCDVIRGWARLVGKHEVIVGGRTFTAPRIVLATGSRPFVPPIPGLDSVPYLTNENLFDIDQLPRHLIIVGGGVIGMEMAQSFRRLGSEVTIIEPAAIMGRDDPESVAVLIEAMTREGVRFVKGKAVRIAAQSITGQDGASQDGASQDGASQDGAAQGNTAQNSGITVHTDNNDIIAGSHLLIAVGRKARVNGFGAKNAGIALAHNGFKVDPRRRTSVKSIYAIGDCRDGPRLTHISGYEGSNVALEIVTGLPAKVDFKALPWCTYTQPEVAQIGLTEADARDKYGDAVHVVKEGFDHNERAIAEGETSGHMKLVLKGKKVLGVSIVGKNAGELLLPFAQIITGKASSFALGSAVIAYPTRSEISKAAAFTAWEPTVFGSLPKRYAALVAKLRRMMN